MSEPRPWLETEEQSPEVLELLRSARRSRPLDQGARERSEWRLARLTAVPAAAGAFFWLQHLALGAALGAVVTAALVAPRMLSSGAPRPASIERAAPSRGQIAPRTQFPLPSSPPIAVSNDPPPEAAPLPLPAQKKPLPVLRHDDVDDGLEREAKMLERARALVSSDPNEALAALLQYERQFGHGTLEIERDLLTVEALVRLGRRSEAEARGRALRARAPGSFYEARLEQLLGSAPDEH